jgi:hypothetical protein
MLRIPAEACRYDSDPNPTYQKMATHYGVGVLPIEISSFCES